MADEPKDLDAKGRSDIKGYFDSVHDVDTTATEEEIRRSWETSFTDPRKYNRRKFCYLVHSLAGPHARAIQMVTTLEHHIEQGTTPPQKIDLLEDPQRIAEKKVISASVIDQDHRRTFADVGLILKAPFENLLKVARLDLGTDFMDDPEKVLAELRTKRKLATVSELLQQTDMYNEVVLTGITDVGKVEVVGFWDKINKQGYPLNANMTYKMVDLSIKTGLPRISIVEK